METRINKKIQSWTSELKENLKQEMSNYSLDQEVANKLIQYVYNVDGLC